MYTIKEIAELAGVAQSTVSRVLNNRPDVSEKTKKRVLEIIDKYNYVPNANAKNLKQINSNIICIIVKGISNMFFTGIVERMQNEIASFSYDPFVQYIDEQDDEFLVARQINTEKKPRGIIFLGGRVKNHEDKIEALNIPCVFATVYSKDIDIPNVSCVSIDDRLAAKSAVSQLLNKGHKDIVVLGGEQKDADLVSNRYKGVLDSYSEKGLEFDERRYFASKFSLSSAYKAMNKALDADFEITAIFAMSDIMAIGAAKAIYERGLSIPGDISVVGFDGIELAYYYNPSLATVTQPAREIAIKSVEVLVNNIIGRNKGKVIILKSEFVSGQSIQEVG